MGTSASYFGDYDDDDQPTLNTVQDYITDGRVLLQDAVAPFRYDDASLLTALNVTLLEARRLRPDLFVYNHKFRGTPQAFTAVDLTFVDMEPQFRLGILHGMCGHALERDQEDYQDIRATAFLSIFSAILVGGVMPPMAGGSGPGRP